MTSEIIQRNYLELHGEELVDQGYSIVPIQPGKKAPGFDGWQKSKSTKPAVREWLNNGFANAGVGILTRYTCAIDIDCLDEEAAVAFEKWCHENIGISPVRIGKAPKRLLLYRTDEPFRKRRSAEYIDEWGDKQLIEVLGDGQQFVAFHIHPETGKPYTWSEANPLNVRAHELIEVTQSHIDSLLDKFAEYAEKAGWQVKKAARAAAAGAVDADNPWVEDTAPVEISDEELRSRLLIIPNSDDYDTWFQIGMALYHQYDGEQVGFDLWNEWSETADNYDPDALERHWKSFSIEGKKRAPLTARFILRLSKESIEKTAAEAAMKLRDAFIAATTLAEWDKARDLARNAEIDTLARSSLASIAKERRDALTGTKTPLSEIKKAIAYLPRKMEKMPSWCDGWVYDVSDDRFYSVEKKIAATKQGFDAMYDRNALTKKDILDGKTAPSQSASALALNLYRVPTVDGRRYRPGLDPIFIEPDGRFANTYAEHEIPEMPSGLTPKDKKNIDRVLAHISHLISDEREQRILLDWLSWVVQNPGKHVNWAIVLQGVEGDGKSFFAEMMRSVMGISNVRMLNAATIIHAQFTGWATGQCLNCVEEIRIVGKPGADKWEAINRIKPFITNNHIEIHPKGKETYNVLNTTSYMMFTNYKDAIPLDDNSRRYCVLFSRWQKKEDIARFKDEQPHYYSRLYGAITESPGAIRRWLLTHEQDESFNPMGDAPDTAARRVMIRMSKPEFMQVLDDLIAEDCVVEASNDLIEITGLSDHMIARGVDWPGPKALSTLLERYQYESLGRVKISAQSVNRFYSRNADRFRFRDPTTGALVTDTTAIRRFIAERRARLDDEL